MNDFLFDLLLSLLLAGLSMLVWAGFCILLFQIQMRPKSQRIDYVKSIFSLGCLSLSKFYRSLIFTSVSRSKTLWEAFPTRKALPALFAGFLVFFAVLFVGVCITLEIIKAIPPNVPHPTEAYKGIGDALIAFYGLMLGSYISVSLGVFSGMVVGRRIWSKMKINEKAK